MFPLISKRHAGTEPCMCRLAQTTYKTPSTVQEQSSPSQGSFCFASPITDQSSPLATFLHQLSHATYGSQDSPAESAHSAQPASQAGIHSPDAQQGPTPFQDFMKYLTQATYHSPGSKADRALAGGTRHGQSSSDGVDGSTGLALDMAAAESIESPGILHIAYALYAVHLTLMMTVQHTYTADYYHLQSWTPASPCSRLAKALVLICSNCLMASFHEP